MTTALTLVTPASSAPIEASLAGTSVFVSAETLFDVTGWTLKPEGFCLDTVCIPARDALDATGNIDLAAFAALTERAFASNLDENVISLGAAGKTRTDDLQTLHAPDFTLPDLAGKHHTLSDFRGKKVLLAAYASW